MKDNYLWDRSGEVDAELEELESVLGALRYRPRPLEIPPSLQVRRRRTFFPALAIAAAIALVAAGLGLWLNLNRPAVQNEVKRTTDRDQKTSGQREPKNQPGSDVSGFSASEKPTPKIEKIGDKSRNLVAVNRRRRSRTNAGQPQLTPEEIAEKEQVLIALRLVSAKLNLAQRRTQGGPALNIIRNQHKIG